MVPPWIEDEGTQGFPSWFSVCLYNLKIPPIPFGSLVAQSRLTPAIPWTVAPQAPLSMGFPRQEYWSGLPFPSPGDLPSPGLEPGSSALQADSLPCPLPSSIIMYIQHNYVETVYTMQCVWCWPSPANECPFTHSQSVQNSLLLQAWLKQDSSNEECPILLLGPLSHQWSLQNTLSKLKVSTVKTFLSIIFWKKNPKY